jgi:hypothetical protein
MSELEDRYRRLLRFYPRSYRAERGDEMVGTLLETSAAGQVRPARKDARALVLGGLRVRSGFDQRLTAAASIRLTVLLAASLVVVSESAFWIMMVRGEWGYTFPSMAYGWVSLALLLLAIATVVLTWTRRRTATLIVVIATAALWLYQPPGADLTSAIPVVFALAVIGLLTWGREPPRLPLAWLGLPGLLLVVELITLIFRIRTSVSPGVDLVPFILLAGTALWSVVDARPMTAVAICIAFGLVAESLNLLTRHSGFRFDGLIAGWVWESLALAGLAVAVVGIWRVRRQAVL